MADEEQEAKTEEPTPRRLEEARRKGQVAQSRDFSGALVFAVVVATLALAARSWLLQLTDYFRRAIPAAFHGSFSEGGVAALAAGKGVLLPLLGLAWVAAVAAGLLQTRGVISFEALRLDAAKIMPKASRVFSTSAWVDATKGAVKLVVAGALLWSATSYFLPSLVRLPGGGVAAFLAVMGRLFQHTLLRLAAVMLFFGVLDYFRQQHWQRKQLRMTRSEVKRENKEQEGDPMHKAERHRMHREILEQRMLEDVRRSDFVVVNPEHIAIAVRYDRNAGEAPLVVARGERLLAQKIRDVAREAGVPIFRDVTLARSLNEVPEGDQIPEALYEAVAELLRVVNEIKPQAEPNQDEGGAAPSLPPRTFLRKV